MAKYGHSQRLSAVMVISSELWGPGVAAGNVFFVVIEFYSRWIDARCAPYTTAAHPQNMKRTAGGGRPFPPRKPKAEWASLARPTIPHSELKALNLKNFSGQSLMGSCPPVKHETSGGAGLRACRRCLRRTLRFTFHSVQPGYGARCARNTDH